MAQVQADKSLNYALKRYLFLENVIKIWITPFFIIKLKHFHKYADLYLFEMDDGANFEILKDFKSIFKKNYFWNTFARW